MKKHVAVVIGTGSYNDLGVIRSCGECGMLVIYITNEKHIIPIHKSRYLTATYFIRMDADLLIKKIDEIIEEYNEKCVVLYPTSDISAYFLDANYKYLKGRCFFANAKGKLGSLMNKYEMNFLAQSCGLLTPEMWYFDVSKQNNYADVSFPCIVKPLKSIGGDKCDISKCENIEELYNVLEVYKEKNNNEILVQKYICGKNQREMAITGVAMPNGECIIYGEIEKKRIRGNGSTVYGVYHPNKNNNLSSKIQEFMQRSEYEGIFDIEFLVNEEGVYFIECNYRNGAYGYAVTYSGFNMPYVYSQTCLGNSCQSLKLNDTIFMEERSDLLNVLDGTISVSSWLRDFIRTDVLLFWNWKDIYPLIRMPAFIKKIFVS